MNPCFFGAVLMGGMLKFLNDGGGTGSCCCWGGLDDDDGVGGCCFVSDEPVSN